jgi:hypothetical protein
MNRHRTSHFARGVAIVPFAGITGPLIGLGKHLDWSTGCKERGTGSEQSAIEKIAAGDFFVHAEELIEAGARTRHEFSFASDCTPSLLIWESWNYPEQFR